MTITFSLLAIVPKAKERVCLKTALSVPKLLWVSFITTFLLSCSGGSVFTTSYQNTIAYFNTYYNAKKLFNDAIEEIQKAQLKTIQTNIFTPPTLPQTARTKFHSVIEKCSKIIQFYPQSSLVDDALLLIGKSYWYLNEILPANKKFVELLDNFPTGNLRYEAKLGLAKTYYMNGSESKALELSKDLANESLTDGEDDIAVESLLLDGQILMNRKYYAQAIPVYEQAIGITGNKKLRAIGAFLLAQCYEFTQDAANASLTYLKVLDFNPDFALEFQARLFAARMFSLIGDINRALDLLQNLSTELLTPEYKSLTEYERASVYQRQGEHQKALEYFRFVDSAYAHTDVAAKSYFQSGRIYETKLNDLRKAKLFYDKAKSEYTQSEVTALASDKSDVLGRYLVARDELHVNDSLMYIVLHPESVVHTADSTLHDTTKNVENLQSESVGTTDTTHTSVHHSVTDTVKVPVVSVPLDTLHYRRAGYLFNLGVSFFVSLERPDSAVYWLTMLLNDYPRSKYAPQALYVMVEAYRSTQQQTKTDSLYGVLLSEYPQSIYALNLKKVGEESGVASVTDSLDSSYAAALLLLDAGKVSVALTHLESIATSNSKKEIVAKAQYAVGWIYENILFSNDSALTHYRLLVEQQPQSIYAERVRRRLAGLDEKHIDNEQTPSSGVKETPKNQPMKKIEKQQPEGDTKEKNDDNLE